MSSVLAWLFIFFITVTIPLMAKEDIPLSNSCVKNSTMVSFELYGSAFLSWQKLTYLLIAPSYLLLVFFLHAADNILVACSKNSFALWCYWSIELLEAWTWGWGGGSSLFSEVLVVCSYLSALCYCKLQKSEPQLCSPFGYYDQCLLTFSLHFF